MATGELQRIKEQTVEHDTEGGPMQVALSSSVPVQSALTRSVLEGLKPKAVVSGNALVVHAELRTDRNSNLFVALALRGTDGGELAARWWQFPYPASECPCEGAIYHFTGLVDVFNGTRQLRVTDAHVVPDADLSLYTRDTRRPLADLTARLDTLIARLDPHLAALVHAVMSDETYARYCSWPAAQRHHGAVRHGLLAHSLRVAEIAECLADCYGADDLPCDRSLIVTAALLHDIGKVHTLPPIAGSALPDRSTYFDHVTLGALLIHSAANRLDPPLDQARLESLLHAVMAHHGRKDWGAPVEPATVEAWLVHLADLVDARLWTFSIDGVP